MSWVCGEGGGGAWVEGNYSSWVGGMGMGMGL